MRQFSFPQNVVLLSFCVASLSVAGPLPPSQLRCEYLKDPEAVDAPAPRFAWVLNHTDRARKQTAVIESDETVYLDGKAQTGISGISGFTKQGDRLVGKVGSGIYVFTTVEREQTRDATGGSVYVQ